MTGLIKVNGADFSKRIHVCLEMRNNIFSVSVFDKIVRMLIQEEESSLHDIFYEKIGQFKYQLSYDLTNT